MKHKEMFWHLRNGIPYQCSMEEYYQLGLLNHIPGAADLQNDTIGRFRVSTVLNALNRTMDNMPEFETRVFDGLSLSGLGRSLYCDTVLEADKIHALQVATCSYESKRAS